MYLQDINYVYGWKDESKNFSDTPSRLSYAAQL